MAAKFPKTLGACVDLAYSLRADRIEYQREVEEKLKALKAGEQALEDHIINTFSKADIEGAKGSVASASLTKQIIPQVKDWPTVFKWIAKNEAWDLMEKRMAKVAYRDRTEAGQKIPCVEEFVKLDLSLTKIKK